MPAPRLFIYPPETVVAEKCQAMVKLGLANSRLKDFYDLWYLATHFDFDGPLLARAVSATFERRETIVPSQLPHALTPVYYGNAARQAQWRAFSNKSSLPGNHIASFEDIIAVLITFLMPLLTAISDASTFTQFWNHNTVAWELTLVSPPTEVQTEQTESHPQ